MAADLRKLSELEERLLDADLDLDLPTLFLFECVLVYMPVEKSHAVLRMLANKFASAVCVSYEQV